MPPASFAALDPGRPVVEQLRERVAAMERKPAAEPIATLPGIASLVSLHAGATYGVDSASLGLAAGEPLLQVSRRLGHSSLAVTADVYSHVSPQAAKEAAITLSTSITGA